MGEASGIAPQEGRVMGEASGIAPQEGRVMGEATDRMPQDDAAARQAAQLEGIERDMDAVDAALSALDSDDLERAEALAAELEVPSETRATQRPSAVDPMTAN